MTISQHSANNPFVTCLDRDHRKGENISFLAIRPLLIQDLWRSPSPNMTLIVRGAPDGIQVLGDLSETKIRDTRMVVGIQKNIRLNTRQYAGKTGLKTITYSLEITVNYVARVEKVKAFGDIR